MPSTPLKLCLSLLPANLSELYRLIRNSDNADILELRLDFIGEIPFSDLRERIQQPIVITLREPNEGGFWKGPIDEKIEIFRNAIAAGIEYLDIEWQIAPQTFNKFLPTKDTHIILSHHTSSNNLEELEANFRKMMDFPAQIYKFVFQAHHLNDCLHLFPLAKIADGAGVDFVIHAMGEPGLNSRLMGALAGNAWTYVAHPKSTTTADGQLDLETVRDVYCLPEKSRNTRIVGLLGYPVAQSSGWKLHNRLLSELKTSSRRKADHLIYLNFPARELEIFWNTWKDIVDGLSITIPHKQAIISRLDYTSRSVKVSGACNTAVKKDDLWYGFNTDFHAIFEILQNYTFPSSEPVLIYGTGATARSTIAALRELKLEKIYLTGRNTMVGEKLASEFGVSFVSPEQLKEIKLAGIVQTTPVGMIPNARELPPLLDFLRPGMLVVDVIYNPPKTRLLEEAEKAGSQIISGVEMYFRQALRQFELFSGERTNLETVKKIGQSL